MRGALVAAFLAAVSLLATAPCRAQEPQPFHLVRALQMLQNEIARGSAPSHAAQAQLVAEISAQFARTDAALWRDRRNAQAAAIFLFSGGRAASLRALAAGKAFAPQDLALVSGAIAYAEGREADARRLLGPIDPLTVNGALGGQLALAQSTLLRATDPKRALELLDVARLLSPGTLVEEAALRRQIMLVEEAATLPRFIGLSSQYLRRFRNSIYAAAMVKRMKLALVELSTLDDGLAFEAVADLLGSLPDEERVEVDLSIARKALLKGRLKLVRRAVDDLLALKKAEDDGVRARAILYRSAAAAVSGEKRAEEGTQPDLARLDESDRQLGEAARQVSLRIVAWPPVRRDAAPTPADADTPLIARAMQSLAAAGRLLEAGR